MLFMNDKYITRGIKEKINLINPTTYLMLWNLIDEMDVEKKDYLQVFNLRTKLGIKTIQEIEHTQEEPPYKSIHRFYTENPVDAKVFVIDDGDHATMLLAEEY